VTAFENAIYRTAQLRARGIDAVLYIRPREKHRYEVIVIGDEDVSKIDAEDGAKLVQALVRTFKNTEIDPEEVLDAPAKLWEQFKNEAGGLGLDLKSIAERVRRGK